MYNTLELTEKQIPSFETKAETLGYEGEIPKFSMNVIMGMAAAVGIWGTTCIISGLAGANGLQELGRGLFTALTGM